MKIVKTKENLKKLMNECAGMSTMSSFGNVSSHGGDVGQGDNYAPGDNRIPKSILGGKVQKRKKIDTEEDNEEFVSNNFLFRNTDLDELAEIIRGKWEMSSLVEEFDQAKYLAIENLKDTGRYTKRAVAKMNNLFKNTNVGQLITKGYSYYKSFMRNSTDSWSELTVNNKRSNDVIIIVNKDVLSSINHVKIKPFNYSHSLISKATNNKGEILNSRENEDRIITNRQYLTFDKKIRNKLLHGVILNGGLLAYKDQIKQKFPWLKLYSNLKNNGNLGGIKSEEDEESIINWDNLENDMSEVPNLDPNNQADYNIDWDSLSEEDQAEIENISDTQNVSIYNAALIFHKENNKNVNYPSKGEVFRQLKQLVPTK